MKFVSALTVALLALPGALSAQTWASWSLPTGCTGNITGTFGSGSVTFSGPFNGVQNSALGFCTNPHANGAFAFTGGANFFSPTAAYSALPDNASFIQQVQGVKLNETGSAYVSNGTRTITFSEAVINPYVALISVGSRELDLFVQYQFNAAFSVLSSNDPLLNQWGVGAYTILDGGQTLSAREFSGVLQFQGTFTSLSFNLNNDENWHGFTVGAPAQVPEPATLGLVGIGLVGLAVAARRRTTS